VSRRKSPLARWIPVSLLLLSLFAAIYGKDILEIFGFDGNARAWVFWRYGVLTLAWIAGAALLNQLVRRILWDRLVARAIGGPVPGVLKEISALFVYLIALTCIVGLVYERSVTGFLAALGAGGIVLGFALRDLFTDIFTGLAINMDRTLAIGDWIEIDEGGGNVTVARIREMGWRCTSLVTEEQTTVIVPNGMLGRERVVNITQPIEPTRYEVSVTVDYAVPGDRVKRVLLASLKALANQPGFDSTHAPVVLMDKASSRGVDYLLRYWILPWDPQSPTTWKDLVLSSALHHLRTAGISLAYPKTDIFHAPMPARQIDGQTVDDEIRLLAKIDLFEPLQPDEIRHLAQTLHRHLTPAGQTLVHSGEEGESLFVLIEGLLSVHVERDGQLQQVAMLGPGQCFGEMSLLTGARRSATVICVTESVVYEIRKEPLQHVMQQRPELAEHLSRILAERQLLTRQALQQTGKVDAPQEFDSLARQLLDRMREFLGSARLRKAH